jgi:FixJ family two-component response regulator
MDVVMPGMNGQTLADRFVSLRTDMRVLFISGHSGDAVVRHSALPPSAAFLQKTFTPDPLARKVCEIWTNRHFPLLNPASAAEMPVMDDTIQCQSRERRGHGAFLTNTLYRTQRRVPRAR